VPLSDDDRMYSIIGGDGKTYGPVPAAEIRRWIAEHRADGRSMVKKEGEKEWQSLGSLEEFFSGPHRNLLPAPETSILEIQPGLKVRDCLKSAWSAFAADPWRITGVTALSWLVFFVVNLIPFAGSILGFLLNGPILGGLFFFSRRALLREARGVEDVSETAQQRFLPCFLSTTVSQILAACPFLVGLIPTLTLGLVLGGGEWSGLEGRPFLTLAILSPAIVGFLATLYLSLLWAMALPLVACTSLGFWEAMKTSWRGTRANFFEYFLLMIVLCALNFLGLFLFCIGLFLTAPLTMLATMAAYEHIFRTAVPRSR